jgi:serine/threonine-protein kinase RsbW
MVKKPVKKEFLVSSDLSQVQKASLKVLEFLKPLKLSDGIQFDIRLCLEEAVINAMKYGNCLEKDKLVKIDAEFDQNQVRLAVQDEGKGFDVKKVEDCTKKDNLTRNRGRGVHLIHQLMDRVQYNEKGNRLLMVKELK